MKMGVKISIVIVVSFLSSCAVMNFRSVNPVPTTVVYTPVNWPEQLSGDLYSPPRSKAGPAVILIHGGGWAGRSRNDMDKLSKKLMSRGYSVFNISYRFAPTHLYPAQIYDVQLAARWLRENAFKYDIDPDRIGAWGYSSGAHLAGMLGVLSSADSLDSPHGGADTRVKAVVAGGIPADLTKFLHSPILNVFIGGYYAEFPDKYREASPVFYVDSKTVPFHLYHAKKDKLVPISQAESMAQALKSEKVPHELKSYRIFGHSTQFMFGKSAENAAISFLDSQL